MVESSATPFSTVAAAAKPPMAYIARISSACPSAGPSDDPDLRASGNAELRRHDADHFDDDGLLSGAAAINSFGIIVGSSSRINMATFQETLVFNAGETTRTIVVDVIGDRKREPDEMFSVNLSGASGAAIVDASGAGGIRNDDR